MPARLGDWRISRRRIPFGYIADAGAAGDLAFEADHVADFLAAGGAAFRRHGGGRACGRRCGGVGGRRLLRKDRGDRHREAFGEPGWICLSRLELRGPIGGRSAAPGARSREHRGCSGWGEVRPWEGTTCRKKLPFANRASGSNNGVSRDFRERNVVWGCLNVESVARFECSPPKTPKPTHQAMLPEPTQLFSGVTPLFGVLSLPGAARW